MRITITFKIVLLCLIPFAIGLVFCIPLSIIRKETYFSANVKSKHLEFIFTNCFNYDNNLLLNSINSDKFDFCLERLQLYFKELYDGDTGELIARDNVLEVGKPNNSDSASQCDDSALITFKTNKNTGLVLRDLHVIYNSNVTIDILDCELRAVIIPNGDLNAVFEIQSSPIWINIINLKATLANGKILHENTTKQSRFKIGSDFNSINLHSVKDNKFIFTVNVINNDNMKHAFTNNIKIKKLSFLPNNPSINYLYPVTSVQLSFYQKNIEDLSFANNYLSFAEDETVELAYVEIDTEKSLINISVSGFIRSLVIGKSPKSGIQLIPSLLEWLYENKKLAIIIAVLAWISGLSVAIIDLLVAKLKIVKVLE